MALDFIVRYLTSPRFSLQEDLGSSSRAAHLKCCAVGPLVDVLVHILEGGKGGQTFDVDVAVVLRGEPGVVWNDQLVADRSSFDHVSSTILGAGIEGVAFVVDARLWLERLRVTFQALPILQASVTTGVNHAPLHGLEQEGLGLRVWPVCPHSTVYLLGSLDFVLWLEEDQHVHVWQASFLEFDCVDVGDRFAKNSIFVNIVDDGLFLHIEHPSAKIGTIGSSPSC